MYKKAFYSMVIVTVLCLLAFSEKVSAHGSGPPYVKVNMLYAQTNPLTTYTTPTKFRVGADLASPSAFLVNKQIIFEIDEQFFPNPYRFAANPLGGIAVPSKEQITPEFQWDFDDGSQLVSGGKVTHIYTKPGTYIVNILVKFPGKTQEYSGVNSVQLNVVPTEDYILPEAIIRVDQTVIANPTRDVQEISPGKQIRFSGESSRGQIVKYLWDFADGSEYSDKEVSKRFKYDDYFPIFPVLRVLDQNGIASDTFVFLDTPLENPNPVMRLWLRLRDALSSLWDRT